MKPLPCVSVHHPLCGSLQQIGQADLQENTAPPSPHLRVQIADLTAQRGVASGVTEAQIVCSERERDAVLFLLLSKHPGRTLVFLNAISGLRRLGALLRLLGVPVQVLPLLHCCFV